MLAWKIGPALASGCSVIVKPAEQTSLTTLRVAELAVEAGVPAGVFNVVTGTGKDAGEPLGLHNRRGDGELHRLHRHRAALPALRRGLEPLNVSCWNAAARTRRWCWADAGDLDLVAEQVVNGAFWNMGENCSATSRLIVQASVKDELMQRIAAYMREWKMGDPLDPENRVGALVSTESLREGDVLPRCGARPPWAAAPRAAFRRADGDRRVRPDNRLAGRDLRPDPRRSPPSRRCRKRWPWRTTRPTGWQPRGIPEVSGGRSRLSREIRAGIVTVNCFGEGERRRHSAATRSRASAVGTNPFSPMTSTPK